MDTEIAARLTALELLVANLIAEQLRASPHPTETAGLTLNHVLAQVEGLQLSGPSGVTAALSAAIGNAAAGVMRQALQAVA